MTEDHELIDDALALHTIVTMGTEFWAIGKHGEPLEGLVWRERKTGKIAKGAPPFFERRCGFCGEQATPDGHDPCIANLPGVTNACCGHGIDEGYVQFENGVVIRGWFDHIRDG